MNQIVPWYGGKAALAEGRKATGIEREASYCAISRERLRGPTVALSPARKPAQTPPDLAV